MSICDIEKSSVIIEKLLSEIYILNFLISEEKSIVIAKEKVKKLYKYILDNNTKMYGAYVNELFVGFVWIYVYEFLKSKRVHINYIAVDRLHRKKCIATLLLKEAIQFAKLNNIKEVDLNVNISNKAAISLYNNYGFKNDKIHMVKSI